MLLKPEININYALFFAVSICNPYVSQQFKSFGF